MKRFELPKSGEYSRQEYYCENLREATVGGGAGLVPVGRPRTAMSGVSHVCVLPGSRILSVASDHRSVSLNGRLQGTLAADYRAAVADGEHIAVFTDGGVQWLDGGTVQAPAAVGVELSVAPTVVGLSAALSLAAKLKGSYPRMSGPLQQEDCQTFASAFGQALKSLSAQAALRGMLVGPAWIGWRILDAQGRKIAEGEPQRFGNLQGSAAVGFTATKDGSTFTLSGYGAMTTDAWTVRLKVNRSASEFWRRRARVLELIVYGDCQAVSGATGYFTEKSGSVAALSVSPVMVETPRGRGVIAGRFDLPLEGVDTTVFVGNLGEYQPGRVSGESDFIPAAVCYGGTLRVYALSGEPGVVGIALSSDPLTLRLKASICDGKILRLSGPVGSGGGWNFGRHHFLAFTTSGIFAVSIDSGLKTLSAAPISGAGIARADAVATGSEAIYCATADGKLLQIIGARVREMDCPVRCVALGWSTNYSELQVLDSEGRVVAITADGRVSARTELRAISFVEPGFAMSAAKELISLNDEAADAIEVCWRRRRIESAPGLWRSERLLLDSPQASNLKIAVEADGGGGSQRLVELRVNGPVNAPVSVDYRSPRRAYRTLEIKGRLAPGSRLVGAD